MAAAKFSSYRPTSKLWASFCSSLGEAWPRLALCTAARSHAATHGRQTWCWAASRRRRYEVLNFSLRRYLGIQHHYPAPICLPRPTEHGLPDAPYKADAEYLRSAHIRPQLAPVHRSRRACSHRCAAVAPSLSMASLLVGRPHGVVGRWVEILLLLGSRAPTGHCRQTNQSRQRETGSRNNKKDLPQKVGRRQSPLLVRAG